LTVILLGPQHAEPSISRVLRELGVTKCAIVTAGWQEREGEPGMVADVGVEAVELALHARTDDVFAKDKELQTAYKARQTKLKLMQDFYRVRLDHAEKATRAIGVRSASPELLAEEFQESLEMIRAIDRDHVERCRAVHHEFDAGWAERPSIAKHIAELRAAIEPTGALVIAGGHVAVLLNRLRLFDVLALAGNRPIIAWSAGAMALTERVVLFHDDPPQGAAISEILDAGLGIVQSIVVLPEARLRLHLDDSSRVAEMAQRYAPARCIAMDHGAKLFIDDGRIVKATAQLLTPSGAVEAL
jgi:hypothetical protein